MPINNSNILQEVKSWLTPILLTIISFFCVSNWNDIREIMKEHEHRISMLESNVTVIDSKVNDTRNNVHELQDKTNALVNVANWNREDIDKIKDHK